MIHYVEAVDFVKKKNYKVNSFHAKSIDKIGEELKPFLYSQDGIIEGFYNLSKRIIGVQFHMENTGVSSDLTDQIMKKFFDI